MYRLVYVSPPVVHDLGATLPTTLSWFDFASTIDRCDDVLYKNDFTVLDNCVQSIRTRRELSEVGTTEEEERFNCWSQITAALKLGGIYVLIGFNTRLLVVAYSYSYSYSYCCHVFTTSLGFIEKTWNRHEPANQNTGSFRRLFRRNQLDTLLFFVAGCGGWHLLCRSNLSDTRAIATTTDYTPRHSLEEGTWSEPGHTVCTRARGIDYGVHETLMKTRLNLNSRRARFRIGVRCITTTRICSKSAGISGKAVIPSGYDAHRPFSATGPPGGVYGVESPSCSRQRGVLSVQLVQRPRHMQHGNRHVRITKQVTVSLKLNIWRTARLVSWLLLLIFVDVSPFCWGSYSFWCLGELMLL